MPLANRLFDEAFAQFKQDLTLAQAEYIKRNHCWDYAALISKNRHSSRKPTGKYAAAIVEREVTKQQERENRKIAAMPPPPEQQTAQQLAGGYFHCATMPQTAEEALRRRELRWRIPGEKEKDLAMAGALPDLVPMPAKRARRDSFEADEEEDSEPEYDGDSNM